MDYESKNYHVSIFENTDILSLDKHQGSEWLTIHMSINNRIEKEIVIRSKVMAEQLHFLLGQVLSS